MKHDLLHALSRANTLLEGFGIDTSQWMLVGPHAWFFAGYAPRYDRPNHFHIMMDRATVPWKVLRKTSSTVEVTPPAHSDFWKSYSKFIKATGFDFDIILSPKSFRRYFRNHAMEISLPGGTVCVARPRENLLIEAYVYRSFPEEKYQRAVPVLRSLLATAIRKKHSQVERAVRKLLSKYEGTIRSSQQRANNALRIFRLHDMLSGVSAFPGSVTGKVMVLKKRDILKKFTKGRILVMSMVFQRAIPLLRVSRAIITDEGGMTAHAAIVSRELKIPCVVGTKFATKVLKDGDRVEVEANKGVVKKV